MTQAFNLSQFANFVDTNGKLTASTGITGTLPVTNGGTGLSTLTANALLTGNGTGNITAIVPAANGYVLKSDGSTWSGQPAPIGGMNGMQVFSTTGTWTVPTGITKCMVYVHGGGGKGFFAAGSGYSYNDAGGCGGYVQAFISGLTPGVAINITVGGRTGTSSFQTYAVATGGTDANQGGYGAGTHGSGSVASSGGVTATAIKLGAVGMFPNGSTGSGIAGYPNASVGSPLGGICYPPMDGYTTWSSTTNICAGSGGGNIYKNAGYYGSAGAVAVLW